MINMTMTIMTMIITVCRVCPQSCCLYRHYHCQHCHHHDYCLACACSRVVATVMIATIIIATIITGTIITATIITSTFNNNNMTMSNTNDSLVSLARHRCWLGRPTRLVQDRVSIPVHNLSLTFAWLCFCICAY